MELSVIIISYNVKFYLDQALRSIQKALHSVDGEIIVVDNRSGDGSVKLLRESYPRVITIANQENVGFARANNQAIRIARGKAVCLINPDTLVREDTFRQCLDYLETHTEAGAVGCKILNPNGTLQLSCRRSYPTPWVAFSKISGLSRLFPKSRLFGRYNLTYLDPDETAEVEALSGSFMMVRREAIDQAGGLDEQFFMYGEDLDWCYRIHEKGWKIIYYPETQIIHYKGMSTREATFDHLKMFYGAMRLFVKKHFKGWSFFPQWLLLLGIWVRGGLSFLSRLFSRLAMPLVDLVLLQAGLALSILIRFGHFQHWKAYGPVNIVYAGIWLACAYAIGLYRRGVFSSMKAVAAVFLGLVVNTSLTFFFPQYAFSRQVVLVAGLLDGAFLGGWRLLVRLASRVRNIPFLGTVGKTLLQRRVLIVGTGDNAKSIYSRLQQRIDSGYKVIGFLATSENDLLKVVDESVPVLGTIDELSRIVRSHRIREIIFTPDDASYRTILSVIASGKGLNLDYKIVPRELDVLIGKSSIDALESVPLVDLEYRLFTGPNRLVKRLSDLAGSLLLLPLWLLLETTAAVKRLKITRIRIDDGFGKSISVRSAEFRSPFWKAIMMMPAVLTGKLSFVGSEIMRHNPGQKGRGYKPGLFNLAGVLSSSARRDDEQSDLYYMKNYSFLLDLEILFKTICGSGKK
jgi:GT2 family glycosyltransferase